MSESGFRNPGWLALAILRATVIGCGASQEPLVPVEGQVFHGDTPLTTGSVVLRPDAGKGNHTKHEPRGQIDADGKFRVQTALRPGAPPGWYQVGVLAMEPQDLIKSSAKPKSLIPAKYNDPGRSGLSFEARTEAPAGTYDLKLKTGK